MPPASDYAALRRDRPLSFAHRGGAALFPENTLVAFDAAVRLGCSHLETDLRMTRDGEIVLLHDATLERTTDGEGEAASLSLSELRRLDAGHRFSADGRTFPWRGQGVSVPTLAELVARHPHVGLNVEIKERGTNDLPAALWEVIRRHQLEDRIVVAAEHYPLMARFRRLAGHRVATGASRRDCLTFWLATKLGATRWLRPRYQALQVPVTFNGMPFITARLIAAARARGLVVHAWTIDDPAMMHELLALGIDGIMSDRPDLLTAVLRDARGDGGGGEPNAASGGVKQ